MDTEKLLPVFREAIETACQDKPSRESFKVIDGEFVFTISGNRDNWQELCRLMAVPANATQEIQGEKLISRWPSYADQVFGHDGLLAQRLPGYEMRIAQLHAGRLFQRGIEMGEPVVAELPTGTGKCLHPDTLITLANGTQCPISSLGHGVKETIVQIDGQMKMRHAPYVNCWASGYKQTYRMTTRLGREIKSSADHRFLTVDGWKRLSELSPGDSVASPRFVPEPIYTYPMAEAEIRFLAYMISDGCCAQSGYKGSVTYTKSDPEIIHDLSIAVNQMENVELRRVKEMAYSICRTVARNGLDWKRNSANVLLENTGLAGKKSQNKVIPDCIFSLPNPQLSIFLGCLFSGDGTVDSGRRVIEFYSVSRKMIEQAQHLLLRFGIVSRMSIKNGRYLGEVHKSWRLTISGVLNINLFRENICLVGEKQRKLDHMDLSCASNPNYDTVPQSVLKNRYIPQRLNLNPKHKSLSRQKLSLIAEYLEDSHLSILANSDVYWDQIVSVEPAEIVETYDIEMDDEHNFLADGFIVHNSLCYLMVARAMGKRVIVSTSNKALQMQLYRKDAPFVSSIFPSKIALVQGKSNYICKRNTDNLLKEKESIGPNFENWYKKTTTGNTQEIEFEADWKKLSDYTVDDKCTGKKCALYDKCFYYMAKAERQAADILICNHILVALNELYPEAEILPSGPVLVIDEAHQLPQYVRNAIGTEFKIKKINDSIGDVDTHLWNLDREAKKETMDELWENYYAFENELGTIAKNSVDAEIGIPHDKQLLKGAKMAESLTWAADAIWNPEDMPKEDNEFAASKIARKIRNTADKLRFVSFSTQPGYVRWLSKQGNHSMPGDFIAHNAPYDVAKFIGGLAGFKEVRTSAPDYTRCCRCGHILTADVVNVLSGRPYGPTCIDYVDPFGDAEQINLHDWLTSEHPTSAETVHKKTAVIFTSATLAAPDFEPYLRECGLPHSLIMQAASPFNYEDNSLLYIPGNSAPSAKTMPFEFGEFVIEQIRTMVDASKGGAFLLFTSHKALSEAANALRKEFERKGYPVFVQGEGYSKLEIINQIKIHGNAVLFATKSFFEGVDIQGDALRLVIIDKMPFAAPSPFSTARDEGLREWARKNLRMNDKDLQWYPFNVKAIPDMIIDLKQGAGRLIRSATDRGVIAILDNRMLTTPYGRSKVLPALPNSQRVSDIEQVQHFFGNSSLSDLYGIEL